MKASRIYKSRYLNGPVIYTKPTRIGRNWLVDCWAFSESLSCGNNKSQNYVIHNYAWLSEKHLVAYQARGGLMSFDGWPLMWRWETTCVVNSTYCFLFFLLFRSLFLPFALNLKAQYLYVIISSSVILVSWKITKTSVNLTHKIHCSPCYRILLLVKTTIWVSCVGKPVPQFLYLIRI